MPSSILPVETVWLRWSDLLVAGICVLREEPYFLQIFIVWKQQNFDFLSYNSQHLVAGVRAKVLLAERQPMRS